MNWKKLGIYTASVAGIAAICAGGYVLYGKFFGSSEKVEYILQKASRSDLELTIAATGTVEPEELVNVGAQVGGMITTLGTDANGNTVNYGSEVKAGMVLARIDDALYQTELQSAKAQLKQAEAQQKQAQTQRKQAEAQLKQAQAQKKNAEAGILQAKAKVSETIANQKKVDVSLKKTELAWERAKNLHRGNASTDSEFEEAAAAYLSAKTEKDAAAAAVESANANLTAAESALQTAEAQISSAEAQISAAKASLSRAERNLEYCVIKSPVDGVIIDRRVNVGQTVNSSMSAPSLFLIAKDLKKMQVWVSVNEADIKRVQAGQKAVFTVDAIPDGQFEGTVSKIRLNATMSQNVVTYVVEITTDNSDLKLLPYLTANVKFVLDSRKNVLSVPNAAFRFKPENIAAPEVKRGQRVLWISGKNGKPQPVVVRTGLNDGMNVEIAEVLSGDLKEGSSIVTGSRVVSAKSKDAAAGQNPFMAKPPARGGKKK